MYDKIQKYWQETITYLKKQIQSAQGDELLVLQDKIDYMESTDMAVVVSSAQNEAES